MPDSTVGQTKQFGKGKRTLPNPEQKAQKWYPAEDEQQIKKVSIFWMRCFSHCDVCAGSVGVCCVCVCVCDGHVESHLDISRDIMILDWNHAFVG